MPIKNTISRQLHNTNAEEIVQMPASVPVPNVISTKPYKAFWTSTYKGKVNGKPMSDWTQWAGENQMLKQNNFILTPKSKVKLLEINTADEFDRVKKVQKDFGIMQRYVIDLHGTITTALTAFMLRGMLLQRQDGTTTTRWGWITAQIRLHSGIRNVHAGSTWTGSRK